ncbi:hypothetical protein M501DRAFT_995857 [Patellaria atrata CBS 101060]|uniref:Myb-like domain-containing protein n=1 Tax=Patellaria atrata CBS 101060 TaxID=1346257 RepID=A0A9P4S7J5_9PEZI|nr:hypothetical protein M501DRAFT_995857 [Patellaria atrata CBS 101060]
MSSNESDTDSGIENDYENDHDIETTQNEGANSVLAPGLPEDDDTQPEGIRSDRKIAHVSRKRKRDTRESRNAKTKRLRGRYSDPYRQLFNSTIPNPQYIDLDDVRKPLEASQIGLSVWTAEEKEIFFAALSRWGKSDVPKISEIIGTKSVSQVIEYLGLLQEGLLELHLDLDDIQPTDARHIASAAELSENLCNALDIAAESLGWNQLKYEAKQESKKHGDVWLLTKDIGNQINEYLDFAESGRDENGDSSIDSHDDGGILEQRLSIKSNRARYIQVPAAHLLDLSVWLELSENIFMNSANPDISENWRTVGEQGETPSIYHTAFSDFHNLTVSITKKVVQVSIFQALSRLRGADKIGKEVSKVGITRMDVLGATEILNMKQSSADFWIKAPRRCGLKVTNVADGILLSHNEVEEYLSEFVRDNIPRLSGNKHDAAHNSTGKAFGQESPQDPRFMDEEDRLGSTSPSNGTSEIISDTPLKSENSYNSSNSGDQDSLSPETRLEQYIEILDQKESLTEELFLWDFIGQLPLVHIKDRSIKLPKPPAPKHKKLGELVDWRDWTERQAEWETNYFIQKEKGKEKAAKARTLQTLATVRRISQEPGPSSYASDTTAPEDSTESETDTSEVQSESSSSSSEDDDDENHHSETQLHRDSPEPHARTTVSEHPAPAPRRTIPRRSASQIALQAFGAIESLPGEDSQSEDEYDPDVQMEG